MDRVQFSPSVGNKNPSGLSVSKSPGKSPVSTTGESGAASGAPVAPESEAPLIESSAAHDNPNSPGQRAMEQQKELNSLTPAVRRAMANAPDTLELVRESIGDFISESKPEPIEGGSGEAYVPEIHVPGSGEIEIEAIQSAESAPAPEVPKIAPPPAVEQDSGGDETDGARGEVVDVVS